MTKPKAKIKKNEGDKDVSGANANFEAKDADSSNNSRQGSSTSHKCAPTSWFTSEIRSMMYGFGDCPKPCLESAKLVEKVVHQQMISLLFQATDLAESRGAKLIGIEDFLFILRKDKVKLARLIRYVSLRDLKANCVKEASAEPEDDLSTLTQTDSKAIVVKNKRRKLCEDFLASIDQTGEFAALFDEELFDDVRYERDKRAELCTRFMDDQQYFRFAEARQTSFIQKNRGYSKLREWLLQNEHEAGSNVLKLDAYAMEVLSYLAFETVAQIVDLALLVKHDAQRSSLDPIGQSIGPGTVNADFPCVQAPLPQTTTVSDPSAMPQPSSPTAKSRSKKFKKLTEASNYSGADAAAPSTGNGIQPAHIREAIRRFYHPLTPFKKTRCTHLGNVLLCS